MKNKNFEIAKVVILNEQLGSPKDLELKVVENSLSDRDKERIKQAVLDNVAKTTDYSLSELARELCLAFTLIQTYTAPKCE
ncbi:hypothetical protein [Mannheimia haemolytica]|uniref:hypothetical protein n=1 Tax=Mannheimia haemolytica TaxID=75985 RepID=UPI002EC85865|nr:hypothetical protein [Mannheimia haemolytica]